MAQNVVEYILDIKTKASERGLDRVADSLDDVNDELQETQRESKKTSSALEQFKKVGVSLGSVGAVIGAVSVAIAGAGVAAFSAAKKITDLTNELNDLSVRSGVSAKTIQGLRQAMLSSGQSAEGLTEVLGAISGQFAQLSTEGSAVEKKFQSFGIAVKDTNGELRSNNDILLDSIKLLQGISDSSERSRTAVTLFGEAGAKLNQALASGDFERFLSFTEKFGISAAPEASKAAAHFQIVLSGLSTVLDGTLQKFVTATDGQNRFIQGMIKLGGIVAFTGSLINSLSDEIAWLTDKFIGLIEFGIKQTIAVMGGQLFSTINIIINSLNFLGIEIDVLNKAMSSLAGFTLKTIDPSNKLGNAIDKATADMKEYESAMNTINVSLDAFQTGSQGATNELNDLGKEAEKTTEKIRTLNDVVNDLLGRFIRFDVLSILEDTSLVLNGIESLARGSADKIGAYIRNVGFSAADTVFEFLFALQEKGFDRLATSINKIANPLSKIADKFANAIGGSIEALSDKAGKISNKFSDIVKAGSEKGLLGAFQSLGAGGKAAAIIAGLFIGIFKAASKLGQRGSTVAEIEKSVEQDIRARAKAIELGLQALPRVLFKVLPPLLVEFADRIIFGFQKAVAEFIGMQLERLISIFTREGRQQRKEERDRRQEARAEEFKRRIGELIGIAGFRSGGHFIPSARGGIKFTGADEGLAMLHRGEFVVPETGQMPQAVQRTMGMGQSGINITINASVVESNAIDELVRQIERRFQTFGSSTSPLFGGR